MHCQKGFFHGDQFSNNVCSFMSTWGSKVAAARGIEPSQHIPPTELLPLLKTTLNLM